MNSYSQCKHYRNSFVDSAKDKLAAAYGLTGDSITGSASLAPEFTPPYDLTLVPLLTFANFTNKLF